MEKHKNLANNLRSIRAARGISLAEFSREIDAPKTTLQAILGEGQTSLYTAIHISEKLCVPLDTLTNGLLTSRQFKRLEGFLDLLEWYDKLPKEKKEEAYHHVYAIIQLIQDASDV